jgi:hypothetical protein
MIVGVIPCITNANIITFCQSVSRSSALEYVRTRVGVGHGVVLVGVSHSEGLCEASERGERGTLWRVGAQKQRPKRD